ncbi:MAG: NADP-dependent malic enzyme [Rickettsiales bacterium]|nr:NADP-dependent malic enzyme [Rickettsiales bacterium]|tara:strand:+ start:1205 stop:3496 length:2292 start_codon:yes stop_codon:yes gene_type:complete
MADQSTLREDALQFHAGGKRHGKIEVNATKALTTQRDLALAYSPGVAYPCLEIEADPATAYDYTAKGNFVAVISNGTAVLGLGNIGALASKPVMEGKSVLFKRFADVDGIDIEVATEDVDEFVNCVRLIGNNYGGINLEDIKAPECFLIEERLKEELEVPVFHDDQHGTAIITTAGFINALHLTDRNYSDAKIVVNGAGASAIACVELIKSVGVPNENVIMCDSRGVIYRGREDGMNQWKSAHAVDTDARDLAEALIGADVFIGLSKKDVVSRHMIQSMADKPIIFAMANPDPEITPEEVKAVRDDAIIATGRSDYPNQVNNVLGFPYIFRGALDVHASRINEEMKIAAAKALAELARENVPEEVAAAYGGKQLQYGNDYIIPVPFDPRLISAVPAAVAQAAMDTGVAQRPVKDIEAYKRELSARLDPTSGSLQMILDQVRLNPKRVVFAEGEDDRVIRAAIQFRNAGYGEPILIGREGRVKQTIEELGLNGSGLEIHNARLSDKNQIYADFLYKRLQRDGFLARDCQRLVNQDRNIFGACMVANGDADAMLTGVTRVFSVAFNEISRVIDPRPNQRLMGVSLVTGHDHSFLIADTRIHEVPTAGELADIAIEAAQFARRFGHDPRVALLSFSNFGQPMRPHMKRIRDAVSILEDRQVDFEFDGDMQASVALDYDLMQDVFPFCRLTGPANVLVMPALHSASISSNLMDAVGGGTVIGPILVGLSKPVQIVPLGSSVNDLVNIAAFAAHDAIVAKTNTNQPDV